MLENLKDKRFGKLMVQQLIESSNIQSQQIYLCLCDCGNSIKLSHRDLVAKNIHTCGCYKRQLHGGTVRENTGKNRAYRSWEAMKSRCLNTSAKDYPNYGGRGITVCDSWLKFENFYQDMGDRPEGSSIDRIDNKGNYEPGNCKWSTPKEQQDNRRNTLHFNIDGVDVISTQTASEVTGLNAKTIATRKHRGWSDEDLLRPELNYRRDSALKNFDSYLGQRSGSLEVIDVIRSSVNNSVYLKCKCDCGSIHMVLVGNLKKTFSCGCYGKKTAVATKDIAIGDVFGKWKITGFSRDSKGRQRCICECACGNVREVDSYTLRSGKTAGCNKCRPSNNLGNYSITAGTKFGHWLVTFVHSKNGISYARCVCDCGTSEPRDVDVSLLKRGGSKSCGCSRRAKRK